MWKARTRHCRAGRSCRAGVGDTPQSCDAGLPDLRRAGLHRAATEGPRPRPQSARRQSSGRRQEVLRGSSAARAQPAAEAGRTTVDGRPAGKATRSSCPALPKQRPDIPEHFFGIKAHSHVLNTQRPARIDDRSEKGVVDVPALLLLHENSVASGNIANLRWRPGEKSPATQIRAVGPRITSQHFRGVTLRVHCDRYEVNARTEVTAETFLNPRHL